MISNIPTRRNKSRKVEIILLKWVTTKDRNMNIEDNELRHSVYVSTDHESGTQVP